MPVLASSLYMDALPVLMLKQVFYKGPLRGSETGLCGAQEEAKSGLDTHLLAPF